MSKPRENKILVGKIVAAQGLRGEVRVQTYTESPLDFRDLKIEGLDFKFVRPVPNSSVIIAKVGGAEDRGAAEALRGTELFIDRGALPDLPGGEFYHADLIGMEVNLSGAAAGLVIAVHNFGAGDILELDDGKMLPFREAKVDLKNKVIEI